MENGKPVDRADGASRRREVEKRNGLAVLLAGCPDCDRIAPPPFELQGQGWLVVADESGVTLVACPEHRARFEGRAGEHAAPSDEPDYLADVYAESERVTR